MGRQLGVVGPFCFQVGLAMISAILASQWLDLARVETMIGGWQCKAKRSMARIGTS